MNRKLLITDKEFTYQICKFSQSNDKSIFLSFPGFDKSKWFYANEEGVSLIPSPGAGKLSIHGSGIGHVKTSDGMETKFRVAGSPLGGDSEFQSLGARHIATYLPQKPVIVHSDKEESKIIEQYPLHPSVFIFYAIPLGVGVTFNGSFDMDKYSPIPPIIGIGSLPLKYHQIFWVLYRTTNLDSWANGDVVFFNDGYLCPLFYGVGEKKIGLEIRVPKYKLTENKLEITL